jgi:hypothetical protein
VPHPPRRHSRAVRRCRRGAGARRRSPPLTSDAAGARAG